MNAMNAEMRVATAAWGTFTAHLVRADGQALCGLRAAHGWAPAASVSCERCAQLRRSQEAAQEAQP